MPHSTLLTFGNTQKAHADLLILLLHAGEGWKYLERAQSDLAHINPETLRSYMLHEADRGTHEVGFLSAESITKVDPYIRCDVLEIHIPRAFLDMNRPKHATTPLFLPKDYWHTLYNETMDTIQRACQQSNYILQLHSMCGYNPLFPGPHKQNEINNSILHDFLNHCYSGTERSWDIVHSTIDGQILAHQPWVESFQNVFQSAWITLGNNSVYQLLSGYPGTDIMTNHQSVLIEIPKNWLANDDTKHLFDTSKIVFNPKKIQQAADLITESFLQMK